MFWGCPYSSTVLLGEPIELVKPELIGKWVVVDELSDENPSYYLVSEIDTVRYAVSHYQYSKENSDYTVDDYQFHTTQMGDIMFLNMMIDGNKDYTFYRLDLKRGEATLFEVTDNIDEKFESSEKMKAFFMKNKNSSFFYNRDEVLLLKK